MFIEKAMARNAAIHIADEQLKELQRALKSNEAAIGDRQAFVDSDVAFHRILFLVPGNPVFESIYTVLMTWLMYRWSKIPRDNETEALAFEGHRAVVRAIARRDPDAAEKKMEEHLISSWAIWSRNNQ
jgi:DNA-binding FadR family transcriptional regulator